MSVGVADEDGVGEAVGVGERVGVGEPVAVGDGDAECVRVGSGDGDDEGGGGEAGADAEGDGTVDEPGGTGRGDFAGVTFPDGPADGARKLAGPGLAWPLCWGEGGVFALGAAIVPAPGVPAGSEAPPVAPPEGAPRLRAACASLVVMSVTPAATTTSTARAAIVALGLRRTRFHAAALTRPAR